MKHHIPILLLVKSPMKRKQINSYTYISKKIPNISHETRTSPLSPWYYCLLIKHDIYIYTWKTPKNHHTISNFMSNISNISYIIIFQKEAKHFHIYISYIYTYTYTYTYSQDIPKHLSIIFLKCSSGHWLVISVYFYGIIHSINGVISVPKTGKGPWLHV